MGFYSKSSELAFNQWVVGSSLTRLINVFNNLKTADALSFFCLSKRLIIGASPGRDSAAGDYALAIAGL